MYWYLVMYCAFLVIFLVLKWMIKMIIPLNLNIALKPARRMEVSYQSNTDSLTA